MFLGSKVRPVRGADNLTDCLDNVQNCDCGADYLTAIYEPIV
jgi:hypothetical protein